ncbi:hypothetical protein GOBAR_AA35678 [Gossypium barbadense]|uniref:Uncharacterized protein n=1 Tax=Gossypium barbadense TaxID=3634 RepID=A0A2P5W1S2_GOSBA|nr:hypothetical protein GOBAR_AA35678 [Gossypium barbadense]
MPNAMKFLKELLVNKRKLDEASHVELNAKLSFKEVHEPCSRNDRGHIHEERRLRIEKIDEWRAHKSRTHDKPKLRQNEFDTSPNLLKVGNKVLLDAADPHIVPSTPNEEIPLTVLSIFPFGTVEVSHPKFDTFKAFNVIFKRKKTTVPASKKRKGVSSSTGPTVEIRHPLLQFPRGPQEELFQILRARPLAVACCIDWAAVEQAGATLRAPQHCSPRIIPHPHRPDEEAYENIPDDVPPQHEDLPTQPPPPSRPVHAAASYADISEHLTLFEQQWIILYLVMKIVYFFT